MSSSIPHNWQDQIAQAVAKAFPIPAPTSANTNFLAKSSLTLYVI